MGGGHHQRALGAIGELEHQRAVLGIAAALLPDRRRLDHRRAQLLGADRGQLRVHDRLDPPRDGHA